MIFYGFPQRFHFLISGNTIDNQDGFLREKSACKLNRFKRFFLIAGLIDKNHVKRRNFSFQFF